MRAAAACAVLFAFFAGCKSRAGDRCDAAQVICEGKTKALSCEEHAFVEVACGGPAGCAQAGDHAACDDSISRENEPCIDQGSENRACSEDKRQSLVCERGTWKVAELCTGPRGCTIAGDAVTCDAQGAAKDDPCPRPGTFSCSADARSRLACKDGRFVFDRFCRGAAGCRNSDVSCDESISSVGDPCGLPGMVACSTDGRSELVCQAGHFAVQKGCERVGCQVAANRRIECQ